MPSPVLAEILHTCSVRDGMCNGIALSHLFTTVIIGTSARPSELSNSVVTFICSSSSVDDASQTFSTRSASTASSRVERNACTRWCGSRRTSPTVSTSSTTRPSGSFKARAVGSSVANSLSSPTSASSVNLPVSVVFPTFVYPTTDTVGIMSFLRRSRISLRRPDNRSSSSSSAFTLRRICLRSLSSLVSPGPLVPMPPPSRDMLCPTPTNRGSI